MERIPFSRLGVLRAGAARTEGQVARSGTVGGMPNFFVDYVENFELVRELFRVDYRTIASLLAAARDASRPVESAVAEALREYASKIGAPAESRSSIELLASGAPAVVTGQQPGLFGGPAYTLYKAVTAIQAARAIQAASGGPCVPVFWNHSDDHSLEEFCWVGFPSPGGSRTLRLAVPEAGPAYAAGGPDAYRDLLGQLPGDLAFVRESYTDDLGLSFSRMYARLLGRHGIVFIEPRALPREIANEFCRKALELHLQVGASVERAADKLRRSGYEPPIQGPLGSGFFAIHDGRRNKVEVVGERFYVAGRELTTLSGARLSPQVHLRPLLEDRIFPTCVYVAGPNEIAYWAELKEAYELLGLAMPAVFPRQSFTVVPRDVSRILEKEGTSAEAVLATPDGAWRHEEGATARIAAVQERVQSELDGLRIAVGKELLPSLEKTIVGIRSHLEAFRRRVAGAQEIREEVSGRRRPRALDALWPEGMLQERHTAAAALLGTGGERFLDELLTQTDPFSFEHKILRLP